MKELDRFTSDLENVVCTLSLVEQNRFERPNVFAHVILKLQSNVQNWQSYRIYFGISVNYGESFDHQLRSNKMKIYKF